MALHKICNSTAYWKLGCQYKRENNTEKVYNFIIYLLIKLKNVLRIPNLYLRFFFFKKRK